MDIRRWIFEPGYQLEMHKLVVKHRWVRALQIWLFRWDSSRHIEGGYTRVLAGPQTDVWRAPHHSGNGGQVQHLEGPVAEVDDVPFADLAYPRARLLAKRSGGEPRGPRGRSRTA